MDAQQPMSRKKVMLFVGAGAFLLFAVAFLAGAAVLPAWLVLVTFVAVIAGAVVYIVPRLPRRN